MRALKAETGDVDLLIRTGGEKRLSDFLLWESAYAELLFTDRMWPDFDESALDEALREFSQRRRYGGLPGVASNPVSNAPAPRCLKSCERIDNEKRPSVVNPNPRYTVRSQLC